ncbi:MAG: PEP/pyruvate-binding domain-containing protein [Anaerolineales bacterium]|nr:PEP/pyruvate-binding domain-containing protein [Anaerolineales bacterium]
METKPGAFFQPQLIPFDRTINDSVHRIRAIGTGSIGGKAQGLVFLNHLLESSDQIADIPQITVGIPNLVVICTDVFDAFLEENNLFNIAFSDQTDDQIAHAFQNAELPFNILGDLQALIGQIRTPLAIRSSSLLEDATYEPFAGVYATKMIPNHQHEPGTRFQKLSEAIKFVYASTFFKSAKSYRNTTKHDHSDEKMAVIIQDVVGSLHSLRYYPELSGVARSYNFYPVGRAAPGDGVVNLALGLGKTIVDGGVSWSYSPAYPKIGPPYGSVNELLKNSQKKYWAINMGTPLVYDPIQETEYLVSENLSTAEKDGTLSYLCSTYDPQSDRLQIGMGNPGPRVLTFSPLLTLKEIPLNEIIKSFLSVCEEKLDNPVEIEFAMTFNPPELELLQVRSMVVTSEVVNVTEEDLTHQNIFTASEKVLGNGLIEDIQDIVYVIPDQFELKNTSMIAEELERINKTLVEKGRPYVLIVFGRLGSSDPWLGIPVNWGQISGTRVIIETYQEEFSVDMSQGSHFFHNLTSLGVSYISVPLSGEYKIDWDWLVQQREIQKTQYVRHIQLESPLYIKIDGRSGRGAVLKTRGKND